MAPGLEVLCPGKKKRKYLGVKSLEKSSVCNVEECRLTCDPGAGHTREATLRAGGVEAWGTCCAVTMETWSPSGAGLVLQPRKASGWSRT